METRKFNWLRRTAIRAATGGVSSALSLQTSSAVKNDGGNKAQYQDTLNGIYSCGNCSAVRTPGKPRWSLVTSAKTAGACARGLISKKCRRHPWGCRRHHSFV